jgi:hypothetical protein
MTMLTDDDSLYVWERHGLPGDWKARLLATDMSGAIGSITSTVHTLVERYGDLSVILWQVQELSLAACGHDRPRFRAAYGDVCTRLVEAAGGEWPISLALAEHLRAADHIMQVQNRFLACEGEWRALLSLADAGWTPVFQARTSGTADWMVQRDSSTIAVEVKTKMPLGTAAGRLTRAFIGLAMLPQFAFLRGFDYTWYTTDNLNDATALAFLQLFLHHADEIRTLATTPLTKSARFPYDRGRFRFSQRDERSFWLELVRQDADAVRTIRFEAAPAFAADHVFTGGGGARISEGLVKELPDVRKAFDRLMRANQLRHVRADTLVVLVWHMPFHALSYSEDDLTSFWHKWCEGHGVAHGALLRVTPGGHSLPMLLTPAAAAHGIGLATTSQSPAGPTPREAGGSREVT